MQIICENCRKKFEINAELIPSEGRLLQCGSCDHKWHYKIIEKINEVDEVDEKYLDLDKKQKYTIDIEKKDKPKKIDKIKKIEDTEKEELKKNENIKTNYFKLFLVIIISFIAIVILIDTFQNPISKIIPNINIILNNLYESLKDINLFFKDLIQ